MADTLERLMGFIRDEEERTSRDFQGLARGAEAAGALRKPEEKEADEESVSRDREGFTQSFAVDALGTIGAVLQRFGAVGMTLGREPDFGGLEFLAGQRGAEARAGAAATKEERAQAKADREAKLGPVLQALAEKKNINEQLKILKSGTELLVQTVSPERLPEALAGLHDIFTAAAAAGPEDISVNIVQEISGLSARGQVSGALRLAGTAMLVNVVESSRQVAKALLDAGIVSEGDLRLLDPTNPERDLPTDVRQVVSKLSPTQAKTVLGIDLKTIEDLLADPGIVGMTSRQEGYSTPGEAREIRLAGAKAEAEAAAPTGAARQIEAMGLDPTTGRGRELAEAALVKPTTTVTITEEAGKVFAGKLSEADAKIIGEAVERGTLAISNIRQYTMMADIIRTSEAKLGFAGDARLYVGRLAELVNIDPTSLPLIGDPKAGEVISSLFNKAKAEFVKSMSRPMKATVAYVNKTFPSLSTTPAGALLIAEMMKRSEERELDIAKMKQTFRGKGSLFPKEGPSYFDLLEKMNRENPVIDNDLRRRVAAELSKSERPRTIGAMLKQAAEAVLPLPDKELTPAERLEFERLGGGSQ